MKQKNYIKEVLGMNPNDVSHIGTLLIGKVTDGYDK